MPEPLVTHIDLPATAVSFSPPQTYAIIKQIALSGALSANEWSLPPRSMASADRANSLANSSGTTQSTSSPAGGGITPKEISTVKLTFIRGRDHVRLSVPLAGQQAVITSYLRVDDAELDRLDDEHWAGAGADLSQTPYLTLKRVALNSELEEARFDPNLDRHLEIASTYANLSDDNPLLSDLAPADTTWRLTRSLSREGSELVPTFALILRRWSLAKGEMVLQKRTDAGLLSDTSVGAMVEVLVDVKIALQPDCEMANKLSEVMTPWPPFARAPTAVVDDRPTGTSLEE
jgi:hypothetical protein